MNGTLPPNDESRFVEFDEGNLLELSRFPASDRREDGLAMAYGFNVSRFAPGWQASGSFGQVIRDTAQPGFSSASGLSSTTSDLLLAGQLRMADRFALTGRSLFDENFDVSKAELRGDWTGSRARLAGSYLWLSADPAEARPRDLSEVWLDGGYRVGGGWTANASLRYDISDDRATRAGLGFVYQNECVTVDLRVNRRYTTSTSIEPSTDFGFTIALSGFSVDAGAEKYTRSCS